MLQIRLGVSIANASDIMKELAVMTLGQASVRCVNCGGPHMSRSSDCEVWKKEKEVMKIKVTKRLTYPEARKMYDHQTPEFTFSKIVSSTPPKPETKTTSTEIDESDLKITESHNRQKEIIFKFTKRSDFTKIVVRERNRR